MKINKLISVALVTLVTALGAFAQDQYIPQLHSDRQMVVGVANKNGGQPTGAVIAPATTATNTAVSSTVLGGGLTPPLEGLSWPVYGTMLTSAAPTNAYLFVTTTGTGNQGGWSIKQLQGTPDGYTWQNALVVSNGLPVATNTISTNIPIQVANFAGYQKMRIFTIQNTTTNAGPAGSTNSITELDQILLYH